MFELCNLYYLNSFQDSKKYIRKHKRGMLGLTDLCSTTETISLVQA